METNKIDQVQRARDAWNILIKIAQERNTITYGDLGAKMSLHHRTIRYFLGIIQNYCLENNLPPLTILIINQKGKLGEGFIASKENKVDDDRKRVFEFDWHSISNPFQNKNNMSKVNYTGYWTFFCNPAKWQIDNFLKTNPVKDTYMVTEWQAKAFQKGQLAVIRTSVDNRTKKQLDGNHKLESGIYAIVEILGSAELTKIELDEFWLDTEQKDILKPSVNIRIIKNLLNNPVLISDLKSIADLDTYLVKGFLASSMPLEKKTFEKILERIDGADSIFDNIENFEQPTNLTELYNLELQYKDATPQIKEAISLRIERGSIAQKIKKINKFKCQICEKMGLNPLVFKKNNGEYYIETHHIIPVSELKAGTLGVVNLLTVCPNHHRQLHFGNVIVEETIDAFMFSMDDRIIEISKNKMPENNINQTQG